MCACVLGETSASKIKYFENMLKACVLAIIKIVCTHVYVTRYSMRLCSCVHFHISTMPVDLKPVRTGMY